MVAWEGCGFQKIGAGQILAKKVYFLKYAFARAFTNSYHIVDVSLSPSFSFSTYHNFLESHNNSSTQTPVYNSKTRYLVSVYRNKTGFGTTMNQKKASMFYYAVHSTPFGNIAKLRAPFFYWLIRPKL